MVFEPSQTPALKVQQPRLWWPAQMGEQNQYDLTLRAEVGGQPSDSESIRFGIREVTFDLLPEGHRLFRINGKRILIRGGGWASDLMLRPMSPERLDAELSYVRDLGLNTIRLEGKLENDAFYARADEYGILTMPGWMCCDRWQAWKSWTKADHRIATASTDTQARQLRNHPSVIDFLIGSDEAPTPEATREMVDALKRNDWPNPISPSASDEPRPSWGRAASR